MIISFLLTEINPKTFRSFVTLNYQILAKFQTILKRKLSKLCKQFCKERFNIKLIFTPCKIKDYFSHKYSIRRYFKSFPVYKFIVLATVLATLVKHFFIVKPGLRNISHRITNLMSSKHLNSDTVFFDSHNRLSFKLIDKANYKFELRINRAL